MSSIQIRRNGARVLIGLGLVGLMASAPVNAVRPTGMASVAAAVETEAQAAQPGSIGLQTLVAAEAAAPEQTPDAVEQTPEQEPAYRTVGRGVASYYGRELAGNRTASGERFNPQALTAAHRTLPLGSKLRVTNQANGRSVVVRVNDRGPFTHGRLIDVSLAAAQQIQMVSRGTAMVKLELLN